MPLRILGFFLLLSLAEAARGHSDPVGDVHPEVIVENGHFSVYFYNNSTGNSFQSEHPYFRIRYSAEGKLVAPRHAVDKKPELRRAISMERFHQERPSATLLKKDGTSTVQVLRWPPDTVVSMTESSCLSPTHLAAAVKLEEDREKFYLYLFPREGYARPQRFLIGSPETIYDFPTASNVVYAEGRFWIAWARRDELVLTSIRPNDKAPVERILKTPGNWNSTISLAAIGNQLCLACHSSQNWEYPGKSTILTEFISLK